MKFTGTMNAVALVLFSIAIGGNLVAGEPVTSDAKKTTGGKKEATEYLEKALQRYRSAKSYQDRFILKTSIVARDADNIDVSQENTQEGTTAILAPNCLRFDMEGHQYVCDGKQFTVYMPNWDQFIQRKLPGDLSLDGLRVRLEVLPSWHPILMAIIEPKKSFVELLPFTTEVESIEESKKNDRDGKLIRGKMQYQYFAYDQPFVFSMWFDGKSGLLEEIRIDWTGAKRQEAREMAEIRKAMGDNNNKPPTIAKAEFLLTFAGARINEKIADDFFVFQPKDGAMKVEEFNWGRSRSNHDQQKGSK